MCLSLVAILVAIIGRLVRWGASSEWVWGSALPYPFSSVIAQRLSQATIMFVHDYATDYWKICNRELPAPLILFISWCSQPNYWRIIFPPKVNGARLCIRFLKNAQRSITCSTTACTHIMLPTIPKWDAYIWFKFCSYQNSRNNSISKWKEWMTPALIFQSMYCLLSFMILCKDSNTVIYA